MASHNLMGLSLALAVTSATHAMVVFDELASGDLSNNPGQPTLLAVDLGSNFLSATASSRDRDYFTLRLPPGAALASLLLRTSNGVEATFLGLQAGNSFTEPPELANLSRTLGYTTFFATDVDTDLLGRLADAPEAIGFSGPLVGRDFTFWVDQKNTSPASYGLEFVIVQIPSPGPWAVALSCLGVTLGSRRRARGVGGTA